MSALNSISSTVISERTQSSLNVSFIRGSVTAVQSWSTEKCSICSDQAEVGTVCLCVFTDVLDITSTELHLPASSWKLFALWNKIHTQQCNNNLTKNTQSINIIFCHFTNFPKTQLAKNCLPKKKFGCIVCS